MKAAVVIEAGKPPRYSDFADPTTEQGEVLVTVRAAALSQLVKSRASGTHYSSTGPLPFVVGVDGVGHLDDGRRVYFVLPRSPFGSMSERTVVASSQCVPVPDDLDDVTAAAIANPGMSSWVALSERAQLSAGETVLINGATGTAGRLAVQIAKHLGAGRVVATGRSPEALKGLGSLGADLTIPLGDEGDAFEQALRAEFAGMGVNVVLDYLWGRSAEQILTTGARTGKDTVPIRFVNVASLSASTITLPSAALRSSAISLLGSGIGSVPLDRIARSIEQLLKVTRSAGFGIETKSFPLSEVADVWPTAENRPRIVFRIP